MACPQCRIDAASPHERDNLGTTFEGHRVIRQIVNLPSGTFLAHQGVARPAKTWAAGFWVFDYWVVVPEWERGSSLDFIELPLGGVPAMLVCLAVLVAHDDAPGLKFLFWGNLATPLRPYRLNVLGWNNPSLRGSDLGRLGDAVRLFREFRRDKSGPTGPSKMTRQRFAEQFPAKYCAFLEEFDDRPTDKEMADALFLSVKTFRRYRDIYVTAGNPKQPTCEADLD